MKLRHLKLRRLQYGTAAGSDKIPMFAVKHSDLISEPISHIVPSEMKIIQVVPIFKSGDRDHFPNYMPVSVLSIFSKLLERVVYNRIYNFINKFNILFDNQYGFRKKHSTSLALIHLYDKITSAIDRKEFTVGIFLDLSKAFDSVNHNILFDKLEHCDLNIVAFEVWHLTG